jgi:hypothetical protein
MRVLPNFDSLFRFKFSLRRLIFVWATGSLLIGLVILYGRVTNQYLASVELTLGVALALIGFLVPPHNMWRVSIIGFALFGIREVFFSRASFGSDMDDIGSAITLGSWIGALGGSFTRDLPKSISVTGRLFIPIFAALFGTKRWYRRLWKTRHGIRSFPKYLKDQFDESTMTQ